MLPTLSRLSVSNGPESRLRHRYSSRYLRISPLHREFCSPLPHSSLPVSKAIPRLSRGLSLPTEQAAYTRFTPSNSEQRLPPTFYRGCWHVVSRGFLCWYCHHTRVLTWIGFLPTHRVLRPEGLRHPRGVAGSGFRPLPKIPHCCLPQESGPYLSASVAVHPLRPATHRGLGRPLPHQLPNGTRTPP